MRNAFTPSGLQLQSSVPPARMALMAIWHGTPSYTRKREDLLMLGGSGDARRLAWLQWRDGQPTVIGWVDGPADRIEAEYDAIRLDGLCADEIALVELPDRVDNAPLSETLDAMRLSINPQQLALTMNDQMLRRPGKPTRISLADARERMGRERNLVTASPRSSMLLLHLGASVGEIATYAPDELSPLFGTAGQLLASICRAGATATRAVLEVDAAVQTGGGATWLEAHDILYHDDRDVRGQPWAVRHALLGELVGELGSPHLRPLLTASFVPAAVNRCGLADVTAPYGQRLYAVESG